MPPRGKRILDDGELEIVGPETVPEDPEKAETFTLRGSSQPTHSKAPAALSGIEHLAVSGTHAKATAATPGIV